MAHPEGSVRARDGFDRIELPYSSWDVALGKGEEIRQAIEDGILRTLTVEGLFGNKIHLVLAKIEAIHSWSSEAVALGDADDELYRQRDKQEKLTGDTD